MPPASTPACCRADRVSTSPILPSAASSTIACVRRRRRIPAASSAWRTCRRSKPAEAAAELKRCAVDLGFPGVVIASELQDQALDAEALRPFWKACADLGLYVFIHPLPRVIRWSRMDADDLGRMLGWEFSLMTAAVRLINCGLLDELPTLRIQFSHFAGGIGRYLGRIRGFQQRDKWGTAALRAPRPPAAKAVRSLSRSSAVLRHRRLGRPRPCRRVGRGLGAIRPAGTGVLADWCSPATIRRPCAMPARSRPMSRPSARLAPMAVRSPQASMPKNSFPILAGALPPAAKPPPRLQA